MTRRRMLYAIIISLILIAILCVVIFFMPREQIYHGTLATRAERTVL